MKAGVVFDFGGVVFRWEPLVLLREALPHLLSDDEAAARMAAQLFEGFAPGSDWAEFDLGRIDSAGLARRIAQRCALDPADVRAVIDAVPGHLTPLPGTVALLRALREAGRPLYFLSNMPRPYADELERSHDFFAWFDGGIFSGRVGVIKPHREIFDMARERFAVDPPRSVFIDDHPRNIDAARQFGWQAIRFHDAAQCGDELRQGGWL